MFFPPLRQVNTKIFLSSVWTLFLIMFPDDSSQDFTFPTKMSWSVFNWMLKGMLLKSMAFSFSTLFFLMLCFVKWPGEDVLISLDPSSIPSTQRNHCALPRFFLCPWSPDCFSRMLSRTTVDSLQLILVSQWLLSFSVLYPVSFCPISWMLLSLKFYHSCFRWQDKSDPSSSILTRSYSPYFLSF